MMRSNSPAMSEISVGSPSPPPAACYPLNMKRLRCGNVNSPNFLFPAPHILPARRKSAAERVKSFSIADILGKGQTSCSPQRALTPPPLTLQPNIPQVPLVGNPLIAERLQPQMVSPALVMLDLPGLSKVMPNSWDSARHLPINHPPGLNPFFPPALLHYEQRLAWDYQRQLQEHFQTQAQLLRQMSMDPNIIPSEDGSERSRSSSGGSQCCSPEVNVGSSGGEDEKTNSPRPEGSSHGRKSVERKCEKGVGSRSDKGDKNIKLPNNTPLNALFQLSTKNFDEDQDPTTLSIFAARPNPKKKRKSRTAFTNHQIFELEKRFLYQKYLSPADRDEIAASLGLSNAQVITWFQNRRAKLKRDMEELKKDVESVKQLSAHKSFLENVNDLSILKTRPASRHHHPRQQQSQLTEIHGTATAAHGQLSPLYAPPPTAAAAGLPLPSCQQQQLQHIIQPANTSTCNKSPHYNTTNTDSRSRGSSYSGNSINRNLSINEATTIQQQHHQQQQQQSNRHHSQNNSSRG